MGKVIIYQAFVRHFSTERGENIPNGTIAENRCGKFGSFSDRALKEIKKLGCTHIWLTGVIDYVLTTPYPELGIAGDSRDIVKGLAGSPYAVRDYYNVSADLADNPASRMQEFEALVERIHNNGLRAIIDFVPNHVARCYRSVSKPSDVGELGDNDDTTVHFSADNNFYYFPSERFAPQFTLTDYDEYPAKATGNDCFSPSPSRNDWYDTVKLNYGVDYADGSEHFDPTPDTWLKMRDILIFWASKGVAGAQLLRDHVGCLLQRRFGR